jgi:hypothetical protein
VPTSFPTFVDVPDGEPPEPGTPDVDAAYLNSVNVAVNTLENTLPGKVDANDLATVAITGAYTDLIGPPAIPNSPDDIGAQPAGDYATNTALAGKANTAHTHAITDLTATGTRDATTFLSGNNTWSVPPGSYTDEQARDAIAAALVAGTNITITPDDVANTITISASGTGGAQPEDADLTAIAALTAADDDIIQRKTGAWTNRTMAQLKTDLALTAADVSLGNVVNAAQVQLGTVDAKGDLIVGTAADTVARVAVGANGRTLVAASAQTAGVEWSANPAPATVPLADVASVALDAAAGKVFKLTATGNRTIAVPTNAADGRGIVIAHTASGAARTLALTTGTSGAFAFGSDITALTETAVGTTDYIGAVYDATSARWRVISYAKGY